MSVALRFVAITILIESLGAAGGDPEFNTVDIFTKELLDFFCSSIIVLLLWTIIDEFKIKFKSLCKFNYTLFDVLKCRYVGFLILNYFLWIAN